MGRVFQISVCLRPFRAAGPRVDTETIGDALIVHNYGHGGSGWSLSWGSSAVAVGKALASSPRSVAVAGCGPLGLTSAILAQTAGVPVTVYAREPITEVPTLRATGIFTPDSRIALTDAVDSGFPDLWEQMARTSFRRFNSLLGLSGEPVRWVDRYVLDDIAAQAPAPVVGPADRAELSFANYSPRLRDMLPRGEQLDPAATPFRAVTVRRQEVLMFNLSSYAQMLMTMFRQAGGRFERREFRSLAELGGLPEKVVLNCTGYGARALAGDETVVPVRGQIAWLVPQREFDYGIAYNGVNVIPRSDGIGVQAVSGGDMRGYGSDDTAPDRKEAEQSIAMLASLYDRFGT